MRQQNVGVLTSSVAPYFCAHLADGFRVGRVGMIRRAEADDHRQPQRDGVAEGMKEGEHAEDDVIIPEAEQRIRTVDVRQHVGVRQHHAFRDAGAAAGEDDGRERLRIRGFEEQPLDHRRRQQACGDQHRRLCRRGRVLEHVLENSMPGACGMFALARNVRDVSVTEMLQRSIAAAIASRPAVKFKLTGTRPAIEAAMLASAPPTEAGSSRPIEAPAGT